MYVTFKLILMFFKPNHHLRTEAAASFVSHMHITCLTTCTAQRLFMHVAKLGDSSSSHSFQHSCTHSIFQATTAHPPVYVSRAPVHSISVAAFWNSRFWRRYSWEESINKSCEASISSTRHRVDQMYRPQIVPVRTRTATCTMHIHRSLGQKKNKGDDEHMNTILHFSKRAYENKGDGPESKDQRSRPVEEATEAACVRPNISVSGALKPT